MCFLQVAPNKSLLIKKEAVALKSEAAPFFFICRKITANPFSSPFPLTHAFPPCSKKGLPHSDSETVPFCRAGQETSRLYDLLGLL